MTQEDREAHEMRIDFGTHHDYVLGWQLLMDRIADAIL